MDTKISMEKKYYCEKCKRSYYNKSYLKKHLLTEFHKTGKRKTRSDKIADIHICSECTYTTENVCHFKEHVLNKHSDEEIRTKSFKFYCKCCRFGTNIEKTYTKHITTMRHKKMIN